MGSVDSRQYCGDFEGDSSRSSWCVLSSASPLLLLITPCHQVKFLLFGNIYLLLPLCQISLTLFDITCHLYGRSPCQEGKIPCHKITNHSHFCENKQMTLNFVVRLLYPLVHPGHYNTYSPYLTYSIGRSPIPYTPNLRVSFKPQRKMFSS